MSVTLKKSDLIDLFSIETRQYPSWSVALKYQEKLWINSLIQSTQFSEVQRRDRLTELDREESESGFVYFGEKLWLKSGKDISYPEWVAQTLRAHHLYYYEGNSKFPWLLDSGGDPDQFSGRVFNPFIPPMLSDFSKKWVYIADDIGTPYGPGISTNSSREAILSDLVQAYHLLHNIGYYIDAMMEFRIARGDRFEDPDHDELMFRGIQLVSEYADSRAWWLQIGEYQVVFFGHNVCIELANGIRKEETIAYAEKFDREHGKPTKPFWM